MESHFPGLPPGVTTFGAVSVDREADTVAITHTAESNGVTCTRMLSTRANVIVDVSACGDTLPQDVSELVTRLRDNVKPWWFR